MRQLLAICWPRDPQGSTQWALRVTHTHISHACSLEASQVNRVQLQTVTRSKHLGGQRGQGWASAAPSPSCLRPLLSPSPARSPAPCCADRAAWRGPPRPSVAPRPSSGRHARVRSPGLWPDPGHHGQRGRLRALPQPPAASCHWGNPRHLPKSLLASAPSPEPRPPRVPHGLAPASVLFSSPTPGLGGSLQGGGAMGRKRTGWGWGASRPSPRSHPHECIRLLVCVRRPDGTPVPGQGGPGSQGGEGPAPPMRLGWGWLQTCSAHPSRFPGTRRAAGGAHPPPGQRGLQELGRSQTPAHQTLWGHGSLDLSL